MNRNHRRIVCWISQDAASIVAAKLAIRENDTLADPLPLVVIAHRHSGAKLHEQAARYLDVPLTVIGTGHWFRFYRPDDVHVIGVPVDEPAHHEAMQEAMPTISIATVLADRALRRNDCIELACRAGLTAFLPPLKLFTQQVAA